MSRLVDTLYAHRLFGIILVVAIGHTAYLYHDTGGWLVDDAFVSFRYLEHWVDGNGLVFNPGERVEGYTNFLWLLLLAPLYAAGLPTPLAAQVLGIALSLVAVALLYAIGIAKIGRRLGWLPAALYALNHALMAWGFGGLELPLFLALFLWGTRLLCVSRSSFCLLPFALAALTRPEGYFFLLLGLAAVWLGLTASPTRRARLAVSALALVLVGAHLAFKLAYYGALLPNTFYAKVGFQLTQLARGWTYLEGFVSHFIALLPLGLLLLFVRRDRPWRSYLLVVLIGYGAYVVYTGGDPLPGFRLALLLLPIGWLAITTVLGRLEHLAPRAAWAIAALLAINDVAQAIPGLRRGRIYQHFRHDEVAVCGEHIGRWLDQHAPEGATVATNTAGSIPYFAKRLRAIDMLGLTDPHIARQDMLLGAGYVGHEKHDAHYVLSRRPDYILLCFSCDTSEPCLAGDHALVELAAFRRDYRRRRVRPDGFEFTLYQRKTPRR